MRKTRTCSIDIEGAHFVLRWQSPADGAELVERYSTHAALSMRLLTVLAQPVLHERVAYLDDFGPNDHGAEAHEFGVASPDSD